MLEEMHRRIDRQNQLSMMQDIHAEMPTFPHQGANHLPETELILHEAALRVITEAEAVTTAKLQAWAEKADLEQTT